jgi:guanylate kinase
LNCVRNLKYLPHIQLESPDKAEREGIDYYFVDNDAFNTLKNSGEFLENAECHGAKYGTAKSPVEESIKTGKDIILEIDYQGAINVKKAFPQCNQSIYYSTFNGCSKRKARGKRSKFTG